MVQEQSLRKSNLMKTNFFQIIAHLKSTGTWTVHISPETNDKLIVSVLLSDPKSNKEGVMLSPMIFNESPKVLDETFFASITEPVKQANELWLNVSDFQKSMEEAKKALDAKKKAREPKDAPKPVKADEGGEKKQRYEDAIRKVAELNGLCKYEEAIEMLPSATEYPDKQADLERLRKELETKKNQLSLL
jgi:PRTRC genetic system protein E